MKKTKVFDSIFSGIVCEILGAQYENIPMGDDRLKEKLIPNRRYTDDTEMTLMIMEFFLQNNVESFTSKKLYSFFGNNFTQKRGYSEKTESLFLRFSVKDYFHENRSDTNGCLMRASPFVWLCRDKTEKETLDIISKSIRYSHNHPDSIYTVYLYLLTMKYLLETPYESINIKDLLSILRKVKPSSPSKIASLSLLEYLVDATPEEFNYKMWGKTYVFHIRAFECFLTSLYILFSTWGYPYSSFKRCVYFGGDVDTVGKVCGEFLGAVYGTSWLPAFNFENKDKIIELIHKFLDM